jgi:hypothetical protein
MLLGVYGPGISGFLEFAGISFADWLYVWGGAAVFLGAWEALKFRRRATRESPDGAEV